MKVVLVNPGDHRYVQPPLGLAYLASYLRKYGNHEVFIIDENIGTRIEDFKKIHPDIIGITATTIQYRDALKTAKKLRDVFGSTPIIIGGVHVTCLPQHVMKNNLFDIGVIGEGEATTLELLETHKKHGAFDKKTLGSIKGIAFRDGEKIILTERRPLISNLDDIPFPARDLLNMTEFYAQPRRVIRGIMSKTTQIMSSRGCPYDCIFCASKTMWNRNVRFFSAEYVVAEIQHLIDNHNIRALFFQDDTLVADKKRLKKICELMQKEGISKKIIWSCQLRSNLVDSEILHDMKKAGCVQVEFGFESGSERVLEILKGKSVSVEMNKKAIELCKKEGLRVLGNFIVGSPGETKEDILQTHKFIIENKMDFVHVHISTPFPGTQLWEIAKQKGLINEDNIDWNKFQMSDDIGDNIIIADKVSKEELFALYRQISEDVDKFNKQSLVIENIGDFINMGTINRVIKTPRHIITYGPAFIKKMLNIK